LLLLLLPPSGWRTAHNPPNPALLDAADELGLLVWDENHRNGQNAEAELLVRRDRESWGGRRGGAYRWSMTSWEYRRT
jgi:hypothetical protein